MIARLQHIKASEVEPLAVPEEDALHLQPRCSELHAVHGAVAGGAEKAVRGKTPADVRWHTIVPTSGREKAGHATQKPLGMLERIVEVHSVPRDTLLDFFADSGAFGEAAARNDRSCFLIDDNPEAVNVMPRRLSHFIPGVEGFEPELAAAGELLSLP